MSHSGQWLPCGALLLAGVLAAACTDSTDPHGTPTPPVEATLAFALDSSIYVISTEEGATPSLLLSIGLRRPRRCTSPMLTAATHGR
jgi:hypothetical protein